MPNITTNELYTLAGQLRKDEALQKHFDLSDYIIDLLRNITVAEKKYIYALMFNSKRFDLNKKLIQLGFKQYEPRS